jgi:hypothetical protein
MPRVQEGAAPPVGYREFRPGDTRARQIGPITPRSILTAFLPSSLPCSLRAFYLNSQSS